MSAAPHDDALERPAARCRRSSRASGRAPSFMCLAWRDLDDPDAGGSEVHADECERRWAAAGLDIVHRTSSGGRAAGLTADRNGYRVVRRGSRYSVFPRTIASELTRRMGRCRRSGRGDERRAVPLARSGAGEPRILFLHHVHGPMWDQILPGLAGCVRPRPGGPCRPSHLPPGPHGNSV